MNREEFKRFAAGQFVIGKSSIDIKELDTYVDGAVFAYEQLNKKSVITKLQQPPMAGFTMTADQMNGYHESK